MDFSILEPNDRRALGAGAIVVVSALLSIGNGWGALMFLSLLGGGGAIAVVALPFVSPSTTLPVTKGIALFGLGAMAAIATGLTGLNWIGWIVGHVASFDAIQFVIGLVAAFVLLFAGYSAFKAERGDEVASAA
jgi:hypothetical protein